MRRTTMIFTLGLAILLNFTGGFGQVTIEQATISNGIGGMMAFKSTSKTMLSGDAQRQETKTEFTGAFMKHFSPKNAAVEITRLDKELIWNLDLEKKQYTEMTFAQLREMLNKGLTTTPAPGEAPKEEEEAIDESEYEWEKPVVQVIPGDAGKKINGFQCKNYKIKVTTIGKHKATGIRDTMLVVNDLWNTVEATEMMNQTQAFNKKMMEKMGIDPSMKGMGQIFSMYKTYLDEVSKEAQKLEGYPILSTLQMTATSHAKAPEEAQKSEEEEDNSIDLSKNPVGGLLGGFAKKMAKQKMEARKKGPGPKEIFQVTTEVKSIKTGNIAADKFEIPTGFKKVDTKGL